MYPKPVNPKTSILKVVVPVGVPLCISRTHPVPIWGDDYIRAAERHEESPPALGTIEPGEVVWAAAEDVLMLHGTYLFVRVITHLGMGWMAEEHLTLAK